jgi:hypothetical protein
MHDEVYANKTKVNIDFLSFRIISLKNHEEYFQEKKQLFLLKLDHKIHLTLNMIKCIVDVLINLPSLLPPIFYTHI